MFFDFFNDDDLCRGRKNLNNWIIEVEYDTCCIFFVKVERHGMEPTTLCSVIHKSLTAPQFATVFFLCVYLKLIYIG